MLPVINFGTETWSLTIGLMHKFKGPQQVMERAMLGDKSKSEVRTSVEALRLPINELTS